MATHGLSTYEMIGIASKLFGLHPRPLEDMVKAIDEIGKKGRRRASKRNRKKMPAATFSSAGASRRKTAAPTEPVEEETAEEAMTREWREIIG